MKVLMITEKDAANISLACIANKFIKLGNHVDIYAPYFEAQLLCHFDKSINSAPISELTKNTVDNCDIIFCSTLSGIYLPEFVFMAHKPVFTHNYLMNRQINWGGDICFAPTKQTVKSDYDEYLNYSYIGIGEPKYDDVKNIKNTEKRFLFIDSGHYPFSYEGKKELARTLLHICQRYPDYEMIIKPRFLPGDRVITHRNNIHIYDVIRQEAEGKLPSNLVMLNYHEDLDLLISKSSTVICMYTTAFVGAVLAGKGLIVLENLKTTDVYDIRHKTYMRNRENIAASGALIDYKHVDRLLPEGAKGTDEYLDFLLDEKDNVADKICETCKYLYDEFYRKGLFPEKIDSTYKRYKNEYAVAKEMTWEKYVSQRCYDYILFKSLILIDFHVKSKLDISYVLERSNEYFNDNGLIEADMFRRFMKDVNAIRDNCIIQNRDIMLQDDIDAGILLNSYYLQKRYDEIRRFTIRHIAAFDLFRAFTAMEDLKENNKSVAKEHLILYFSKSMGREYNLEISDMPNNKFKAFRLIINILTEEEAVEEVRLYCEALTEFYMKNYMLESFDDKVTEAQQKERYLYICDVKHWIEGRLKE